ncbi:DUF362 domain-containing protein [Treponema primitia]|uniref:DUF362 domain-containing protein n=1 Tax=Treponema primitia TaxID=88058 RepID=UPI0002555867|nr:DUF362 domain-containing protein [Treponema primitia]
MDIKSSLKKYLILAALCFCGLTACSSRGAQLAVHTESTKSQPVVSAGAGGIPKVYMTTDISPAGLAAMYEALGRRVSGKVAVKISTGEPGGHHFLAPDLIKDLVHSVNGTIVESNTAYGGRRASTALHRVVVQEHGFTAIAPVDILDEDGSASLPFARGKNITEDFVGSHFTNYDSVLVLSHFKGHPMGGFGGAIKNISIGIASTMGKAWIHSGGTSKTNAWGNNKQDAFLESMAEAAGAVMYSLGDNIMYISVMNHLSVDCDCSSNPAPPEMDDIGILASLDPVALDKACVDQVYASDTKRSASLRQRIESRNGMHTLDHAEALGLGSQKYELVSIDG